MWGLSCVVLGHVLLSVRTGMGVFCIEGATNRAKRKPAQGVPVFNGCLFYYANTNTKLSWFNWLWGNLPSIVEPQHKGPAKEAIEKGWNVVELKWSQAIGCFLGHLGIILNESGSSVEVHRCFSSLSKVENHLLDLLHVYPFFTSSICTAGLWDSIWTHVAPKAIAKVLRSKIN